MHQTIQKNLNKCPGPEINDSLIKKITDMKAAGILMRGIAWLIITILAAMLALPSAITAQETGQPQQPYKFKNEELAQMLAPIALYPDSLIADILMGSTYPLEVVEAERWLRQNKDLKGDELDNALQNKAWDASIKVLCHFPDLLFSLSEKLDQTRKLGDAFLSQQEDVMAMIQELRRKAEEQGNLKTTKEQSVTGDQNDIRVEPVEPGVVYVPVYDPVYVYGPWWYPAYPPYYWYYPPDIFVTGGYIGFGVGFFVGTDVLSWYWLDWPRHVIHIDHNRERHFDHFDRNRRDFDVPFWRHNPYHRRGVAYRDSQTAERFGVRPFRPQPVTPEMRGYPESGVGGPAVSPSPGHVKQRERGAANGGNRKKLEDQGTKERDFPFSGIGDGSFERRAGERGGMSRQRENEIRQGGGQGQGGGNPGTGDNRKGGGFGR